MDATIDARVSISIDEGKTVTDAEIAEALTEQDLEATILEELVGSLDEQLVEDYCGEKHARGNGDKRYQRAGTDDRTISTTLGEHELELHYVEDDEERSYFQPIKDVISFDGQNHYQEGVAFKAAKAATKLSYRDAAEQVAEFAGAISHSTIHRRVKRFGGELNEFLHDDVAGNEAETVMADGTLCHSQEDGVIFHDVNITLNRDVVGEDGETTLLDVNVDGTWEDTAAALRRNGAIPEDVFLTSDAEEALRDAFCAGNPSRHVLESRPFATDRGVQPLGR